MQNPRGRDTQALKIARLAEAFGVRTGWHGPGNIDPINHAAQGPCGSHDAEFRHSKKMWIWGWGRSFRKSSGCPQMQKGYMYLNESARDWR